MSAFLFLSVYINKRGMTNPSSFLKINKMLFINALRLFFAILLVIMACTNSLAQESASSLDKVKSIQKSDLLILGTFHFINPGLDSYKAKTNIDILTQEKQKELEVVLKYIEEFKPTKIAVEYPKRRQERLDSLYGAYLSGKFELPANEVYQVGFKLAKRLAHQKVYAIDVKGRSYFNAMSDGEYDQKEKELWKRKTTGLRNRAYVIDSLYFEVYRQETRLKMRTSLLDYYINVNSEERNQLGHGIYLNGNFRIGEDDDYFGPDSATRWYNRNLRMFHNLSNVNIPGKDRVFLVVGKGHLSLLNFLADASPDFKRQRFGNLVK
ncbi:MAG: DUF5694 domain-containing protein [Bacteroidota bacterium]